MRLLLDECCSYGRFHTALVAAGHDVELAAKVLGPGTPDSEVAAYARRENRTLLTQDTSDFRSLYETVERHPGLILLYFAWHEVDLTRTVEALENLATIYRDQSGLILSLAEFFW